MTDGKQHVSIVICGHVDAGGIPPCEMYKLKEADRLGKGSFSFAFYMDLQKEERERGVTISCTIKEFFTASKHYLPTIVSHPTIARTPISGIYKIKGIGDVLTGRVEQER
eukprot:TRINITY_DN10894_c0_g1_i1.p1 TRINITY_DN10894_c0_g1~~TRINITY_DN10894_c0_g1_i1.p1  ORF type:complete len:110 (+),score=30.30 TRINITY_DN10894_c0_g1_i1:101-430(+)